MSHLQVLAGIAAGMMIAAGVGLVMSAGIRVNSAINHRERITDHARIHGADLWEWESPPGWRLSPSQSARVRRCGS
jgi:hypothetical protein